MARPKKTEETATQEGSIPNLEALDAEYSRGKMPAPKASALRKALIRLFNEKKITEDEQELMEKILRRERNLNIIAPADLYLLNALESERIEERAVVKTDDAPVVHHLKRGLECRFVHDPDFNDNKNRKDSIGRYYVYVPRTIKSLHQLNYEDALKHSTGKDVDMDKYKEKTVIHRRTLKEFEFHKWFEVVDEDILNEKPEMRAEEAYRF